jgi:RHS repeat-associated protein
MSLSAELTADSLALVALYDSTNGPSWTTKTNWKTGNLSTWYGVTITNGRVTRLQLIKNNLNGIIPESIGNLTGITILNLSDNKLQGEIPESLGNLVLLTQLQLQFNELTGSIPASLGNLTLATHFYVYRNKLSGDLPSSLGNLKKLQYLGFHVNDLTGNFDWIGNLTELLQFYFYGNPNLSCTIPPSIGNLTKMTRLCGGGWLDEGFVHTKVTGVLPASLNKCIKLQWIYLDNSEFYGEIPVLTSLTSLNSFNVFNNENLAGNISTSLSGLVKLNNVRIYNTQIGGTPPTSIMNSTLQYLQIANSKIRTLPANITSATNLTTLYLDSLQLAQVPNWSANFPKLSYFSVNHNNLTSIPSFTAHANKANLQYIVSRNKLDFGDLEPNFTAANTHPYQTFTYSPQEELGEEQTLYWTSGNADTLRVVTPGSYNLYQWQKKDNVGAWTDLSGATSFELIFPSVAIADSGQYRLKVTNQWVTGLDLYSKPISIKVTEGTLPPESSDVKICAQQTATLSATGNGTIQWYDMETDGTQLGIGASFTTPVLDTTTVFYVSQTIGGLESIRRPVKVTVDSLPTVIANADLSICAGKSDIISVSGNALQYAWDNGLGSALTYTVSPSSTTTYIVTGTGANGCQATDLVIVTVNPLPTASIAPASPTICVGSSAILTASGGASYQWSTGQAGRVITVRPAATTTYTVTVTNSNGCTNTSSAAVTVSTTCPAPPEELRAVAVSSKEILLTWTNVAVNQTGFKVERKTGTGNFTSVTTLGATVTSYSDANLQPSTIYTYRIRALQNTLESEPSNEVSEQTFSTDQHYQRETTVLVNGITDPNVVSTLPVGERIHTWNYLDGEGRPIQNVIQEFSAGENDMVQPIQYDALGRQAQQYLPYTISSSSPGELRTNAVGADGEQKLFYDGTTTPPNIPVESLNPFSERVFEPSPLSRVKELSSPGSTWNITNGKTGKMAYSLNAENEVLIWQVDGTSLIANGYFNASELYRSIQEDAEHDTVILYTDKFGRTILQKNRKGSGWISTYSVYDAGGNLTHQITPLAVAKAEAQSGFPKQLDATIINKLCYVNGYDNRQRLVSQKTPGAEPIYYIYDKWYRVALSQDGRQRLFNQWTCSKYDRFNRVVLKGVITDSRTLNEIQVAYDNATVRYDSRSSEADNFHGYTNVSLPIQIDTVLSVSYYDDYTFLQDQNPDVNYSYKSSSLAGLPSNFLKRIDGMFTGNKMLILGTNEYMWSVSYYDDEYHIIQTVGTNHLGGIDRQSQLYNFADWKTAETITYFEGDAGREKKISKRYEYDHVGRLLRTFHKVDQNNEVQLNEFAYNELGQLINKDLHVSGGTPLQSIDYRYTINGSLSGINADVSGAGEPVDYFSEALAYENELSSGSTPRYDGLISAIKWRTDLSGNKQEVYSYTYDALKRLTSGVYKADSSGTIKNVDAFSEKGISYDLNGNIKTLSRYSHPSAIEETDNLSYTYDQDSNHLLGVTDNSTSVRDSVGFHDKNKMTPDYAYDANGSVIKDLNKGITSIKYNILNLPSVVLFNDGSYIVYKYDALGIKLSETSNYSDSTVIKKTDFVGGLTYENDALAMIHHDEGIYLPSRGYQYFLSDHLGSTRVILGTVTDVYSSLATLESSAPDEQSKFLYYDEAVKIDFDLFNHTQGTSTKYSARLNGTEAERTGLAKSLSVMPGDTVRMDVWAKYLDPDHDNWTAALNTFMTSIYEGTASPSAFIDGGAVGSTGGIVDPYAALLTKDDDSEIGPKAYLNYLVFDRNFKLLDAGYERMSDIAKEDGTDVDHEHLEKELVIKEPGYVYIYISNENETPLEVYFDDFNVDHIEGPVVQVNAYYPYGMTSYAWVRENESFTSYLFQGKKCDSLTQWHDFHARQYDATLGRFLSVDPRNQFASGFVGMANNPVVGVDPDGQWVNFVIGAIVGGIGGYTTGKALGKSGWSLFGYTIAGAGIGAVTAGIGSAVSAGTSATLGATGSTLVGGTVAGAFNGAAMAGLGNGNIGQGAMYGAIGGFAGSTASLANVNGIIPGAAYGAGTGGLISGGMNSLNGGSFGDGFKSGVISGAIFGGIGGGISAAQSKYERNLLTGGYTRFGKISALKDASIGSGVNDIFIHKMNGVNAETRPVVNGQEMLISDGLKVGAGAGTKSNIHFRSGKSLRSMIKTLNHELVHVNDIYSGQIYSDYMDARIFMASTSGKVSHTHAALIAVNYSEVRAWNVNIAYGQSGAIATQQSYYQQILNIYEIHFNFFYP